MGAGGSRGGGQKHDGAGADDGDGDGDGDGDCTAATPPSSRRDVVEHIHAAAAPASSERPEAVIIGVVIIGMGRTSSWSGGGG